MELKRAERRNNKDKKSVLNEKDINEVKLLQYKENEYEFIETNTRNILLCGRTRSGKTTTMGILKDPCYQPNDMNIFSETINPKFQSFSINNKAEKIVQKYTLNIIDTPGLFEVKEKNSVDKERNNNMIENIITQCLNNEITNIHVIIIFSTFEAGINLQDIEAMKLFLQMFGGSGVRIGLCITHADKHDEAWQKSISEQIQKHKELEELITNEGLEILFIGCVNHFDKKYYDKELLIDDYDFCYEMRSKMLKFIFESEKRIQLTSMNIAKQKIIQIKSIINDLIYNFQRFCNITDYKTAEVQELIINHKNTIAYLSENGVYLNTPELSDLYIKLLSNANEFKNKNISNDIKLELLWPLRLKDDIITEQTTNSDNKNEEQINKRRKNKNKNKQSEE